MWIPKIHLKDLEVKNGKRTTESSPALLHVKFLSILHFCHISFQIFSNQEGWWRGKLHTLPETHANNQTRRVDLEKTRVSAHIPRKVPGPVCPGEGICVPSLQTEVRSAQRCHHGHACGFICNLSGLWTRNNWNSLRYSRGHSGGMFFELDLNVGT